MKVAGFLLVAVFVLSACGQQGSAVDPSLGKTNTAKWNALMNAGDLDGLAQMYTEDARVMPPNGVLQTGHDAVRASFGGLIDANITGELTSVEFRGSGDVAYNLGTYVLKAGGETIDEGKWIETWQRGADGVWRISNDIWNSSLPVAAPEKPMTHLVGIHKVGDPATWLAAWRGEEGRRKDFAANGAPHVHVMQSPDDPKLTGLVLGLSDPAAFETWLNSEAGQAAAAEDTVDMSTLQLLREVE